MPPTSQLLTLLTRLLGPLFPQQPLPQQPQSIIVIKPCCLGDVILATPTVAALRQRYPEARLDIAVGSWSRAALANNPHLNHVIDSGRVGQGTYSLPDLKALVQQLRRNRYELAVVLDRSPLIGLMPWLAGIPRRLGLDSFGRGFAHTRRVPVPSEPRHEALIYLDCVAATGIATEINGVPQFRAEFYPAQADFADLPPFERAPAVILHPGGGTNPGMAMLDKRWPQPHFVELADRLQQAGFQIVLTGTADDQPLCQAIANRVQGGTPQILAGRITLSQFGALCRRVALFVGGDTGAMHLAVASGCKTVAIFGPSDPRRYGAFAAASQAISLWRAIAIPPGGVGQGQVVNFSWESGITVEEVWEACQKLLGGSS